MSRHAHFDRIQTTPPVEKDEGVAMSGEATPAVEMGEPIPFSRSVVIPIALNTLDFILTSIDQLHRLLRMSVPSRSDLSHRKVR